MINAISFIFVIGALWQIKIVKERVAPPEKDFKKSFLEGLRYTFGTKEIRNLILLLGVMSLTAFPSIVLILRMPRRYCTVARTPWIPDVRAGAGALVGHCTWLPEKAQKGWKI